MCKEERPWGETRSRSDTGQPFPFKYQLSPASLPHTAISLSVAKRPLSEAFSLQKALRAWAPAFGFQSRIKGFGTCSSSGEAIPEKRCQAEADVSFGEILSAKLHWAEQGQFLLGWRSGSVFCFIDAAPIAPSLGSVWQRTGSWLGPPEDVLYAPFSSSSKKGFRPCRQVRQVEMHLHSEIG